MKALPGAAGRWVGGQQIGIGLLAKWTLPVYLLLPTLLVIWQTRLWRAWGGAWQLGFRPAGKAALLAAAGAAGIAWLLYWPARDAWQATWLGPQAAAAWFVLWFVCLFCLLWHKAPATNFLAGLALAGAIAGLWYLPELRFIFTLSSVAMGEDRGVLKPGDLERSGLLRALLPALLPRPSRAAGRGRHSAAGPDPLAAARPHLAAGDAGHRAAVGGCAVAVRAAHVYLADGGAQPCPDPAAVCDPAWAWRCWRILLPGAG